MDVAVITCAERPELEERAWQVTKRAWPRFLLEDDVAHRHFWKLYSHFPEFQFFLVGAGDEVVAVAHAIPFAWDGDEDSLPDRGWDAILEQGVADRAAGRPATALSALEISVDPAFQGRGLSHRLVEGMQSLAGSHHLRDLVAPVRPIGKAAYPLIAMERYGRWTREDGAPFDPWMRVHWRAGARLVRVCPRSMTVTGSVSAWQRWTGMALPETGSYVVAGALVPVEIDREADKGTYVEPNVWMRHAPSGTAAPGQ